MIPKKMLVYCALLMCALAPSVHAQEGPTLHYTIYSQETVYWNPSGGYVPNGFRFSIAIINTGNETARNICVEIDIEDTTLIAIRNPEWGNNSCLDSLAVSTSSSHLLSWTLDVIPALPLRDSTFVQYVITSFDSTRQSQPDTIGVGHYKISLFPDEQPLISSMLFGYTELGYSDEDRMFFPNSFPLQFIVQNIGTIGLKDVTITLHSSDPEYLLASVAGDSLIRTVDSIPAAGVRPIPFVVQYSADTIRDKVLYCWIEVSGVNSITGDPYHVTGDVYPILLLDFLKPQSVDIHCTVEKFTVGGCSGYLSPSYPITLTVTNTGFAKASLAYLELNLPAEWSFASGFSKRADVNDYLDPNESYDCTWQIIPSVSHVSQRHTLHWNVFFSQDYFFTDSTHVATPPFPPQLKLNSEMEEIHVVYDTTLGQYSDVPVQFSATLCAWGSEFDAVAITADLVNGAWMYLEMDTVATNRTQFGGPFAQCDSATFHWQANLVNPNTHQTPFIGAIKYTVYNADSSIYKEYIQQIIIDPVNTNGVSEPPTAEEMTLSAYPNPFAGRTTIEYTLHSAEEVTLTLYEVMGRKVETLYEGPAAPGTHSIEWHQRDLPPGAYTAVLQAGGDMQQTVVVLQK